MTELCYVTSYPLTLWNQFSGFTLLFFGTVSNHDQVCFSSYTWWRKQQLLAQDETDWHYNATIVLFQSFVTISRITDYTDFVLTVQWSPISSFARKCWLMVGGLPAIITWVMQRSLIHTSWHPDFDLSIWYLGDMTVLFIQGSKWFTSSDVHSW